MGNMMMFSKTLKTYGVSGVFQCEGYMGRLNPWLYPVVGGVREVLWVVGYIQGIILLNRFTLVAANSGSISYVIVVCE